MDLSLIAGVFPTTIQTNDLSLVSVCTLLIMSLKTINVSSIVSKCICLLTIDLTLLRIAAEDASKHCNLRVAYPILSIPFILSWLFQTRAGIPLVFQL